MTKKLLVGLLVIATSINGTTAVYEARENDSKSHLEIEGIITQIFYEEIFKKSGPIKPLVKSKTDGELTKQQQRGNLAIEAQLQKNRAKLAKMRGLDPSQIKSGDDLIEQQLKANRAKIKSLRERQKLEAKKTEDKGPKSNSPEDKIKMWHQRQYANMVALKKKVEGKRQQWHKRYQATLEDWKKAREKFLLRIDEVKKNLEEIPEVKEIVVPQKEIEKPVEVVFAKDHHIVSNAFSIKIRDQGRRPTCSAFAGIRAIEIILAQNAKELDLSEQYFYWASKPDCRQKRCNRRGSWVGHGLDYSREAASIDIPSERRCPYRASSQQNNETQIPLPNSCNKGSARVKSYAMLKNLDQVVEALNANRPVVASFRLSQNFYDNRGLVLYSERNLGGSTDSHAQGHAVLLVGVMKLPEQLGEGKLCFVTANSWGAGWGHGGYACLSEKWAIHHRRRNPFVAIEGVEAI